MTLRSRLNESVRNYLRIRGEISEEDNLIQRRFSEILDSRWYPRVRWIGESILLFMLIIYSIFFIVIRFISFPKTRSYIILHNLYFHICEEECRFIKLSRSVSNPNNVQVLKLSHFIRDA